MIKMANWRCGLLQTNTISDTEGTAIIRGYTLYANQPNDTEM